MRLLFVIFFIASAASYYLSVHNRQSPLSLELIELESQLPAPIWQLSLLGTIILGLLSFRKSTVPPPTVKRAPSPKPQKVKKMQQPVETELSENWRTEIVQRAQSYSFPRGGKIILDTQKDIPFTLKLGRLSPLAQKDSIDHFARFVSSIPTPKRVSIRFEEKCTKDIQNIIRASFRKHHGSINIVVRTEEYRSEVQFGQPDQKWGSQYNIIKIF